jgi:signal transduction histidine kinase
MGLELLGSEPSQAMRDQIAHSISEVDQLIEEILLASRLDSPEADLGSLETVDLVGLAAEECARVGAHVHVLSTPESLQIAGYPHLLRRLLRNLLDNARRYAPGQGELDVEIEQSESHALVLRVNDRGPGISTQYLEQVFSPFFRLPGSAEGGVGLGLALVRSIVKRHHGRVWCENRPGGGASFVVELPQIHEAAASTR